MPNWTWNNLRATPEIIKSLLNENGEFSFNNLIPMPECLCNTVVDSTPDFMIKYHDLTTLPFREVKKKYNILSYVGRKKEIERLKKYLDKCCKKNENGEYVDEKRHWQSGELFSSLTARDYYKIKEETGFFNWYDWSCANWGVKWDASNVCVADDGIDFDTPWGAPIPILELICKKFPDADIEIVSEYEDNYLVVFKNDKGKLLISNEYEKEIPDDDDYEYDELPWKSIHDGSLYEAS